jgi:hypothetical protein
MKEVIRFYFSITCCVLSIPIGFFGNIISIFIFDSKEFKKQSGIFYFKIDCIMNMIMLSQLPNQLMLSFWTSSDTGCRLSFGIMLLTSESQSWITVLCSIDRLLGVIAPNRFSFVKKMKFQVSLILIIVFLIFMANFPFAYAIKLVQMPNATVCYGPINDSKFTVLFYFGLVNISLFRTLIPFTIMIVSSILIFKIILKSKKNVFKSKDFTREKELGKSLIALDTFFIICSLPLLFDFYVDGAKDEFLFGILYFLTNFYNVFLFVLFYFSNKIYRSVFKEIMKRMFPRFKKRLTYKIQAKNSIDNAM